MLAVAALVAVALLWQGGSDDGGPGGDGRGVAAARDAGLGATVTDDQARDFVSAMCASQGDVARLRQLGTDLGTSAEVRQSGLRATIRAIGAGAAAECSDEAGGADDAVLTELQCYAVDAFVASAGGSGSPVECTRR